MDLSNIEERLASIEQRLSRVEGNVKISAPPATPMTTPRAPISAQTSNPSQRPVAKPAVYDAPKPGSWLGIIAIICFVLAAGFIIKLSIESGWLTPERQIGLAALLGICLVGSGLALMKSDREYASLLPGAGIIVLYLTVFAAHSYYALISFELAIAFTSVVSGACIWLYTQIRHDVYPITAAVGSYLAPAILGIHTDAIFSIYYFLLCSVSFATISIGVQSRTLTLVSAYLAILMTALIGFDLRQDAFIAVMLALHFFTFSLGTYFYTTESKSSLSESEAWNFLPVLLIFYAMEYYFIDRIHPGLAPWISLGFAGVLIGLYLSAKTYFPDGLGSQSLILAFATIVCFHSVYLELLPADVRPWLFVLIILGIAFSPGGLSAKKYSPAFRFPMLAILAILGIEYISMLFHLLSASDTSWLLVSGAAFASLWFTLVATEQNEYGHTLLGAAHLLAVLGLYRLTTDQGSLAVSASWLFYAVCVIVFAFSRKDEVMAKSALFVLAFAAGKALLYDAASAPTVIRILCLLMTGVVLYGSGLLMRKFAEWTRS